MSTGDSIQTLAEQIVARFHPVLLYLISQKRSLAGELTSFKLCAVIAGGDSKQVEHDIYVELDSELPYDIVVYTKAQWEAALHSEHAFAGKIRQTGILLYEQK